MHIPLYTPSLPTTGATTGLLILTPSPTLLAPLKTLGYPLTGPQTHAQLGSKPTPTLPTPPPPPQACSPYIRPCLSIRCSQIRTSLLLTNSMIQPTLAFTSYGTQT